MSAHRTGASRPTAALLALLLAAPAAALDVTGRVEPGFDSARSTVTDATGASTVTDTTAWSQRYTLNLEERPFPLLRILGHGYYESALTFASTNGVKQESDTFRWTASGRATLGDAITSLNLGYDRSVQGGDVMLAGRTALGDDLVREAWTAAALWRPDELPALDLRLSRTNTFDEHRAASDLTTDEATAGARWRRGGFETRYRFSWQRPVDHRTGTETSSMANGGRVAYTGRLWGDRVQLYGSYDLTDRRSETRVSGTGGSVTTQQFPVAGLSVVEPFGATPERVTLQPNGALVDGDTTAGAGLDLGFGPTLAGDTLRRHLGVQFSDAVTPVSALWVWVDRTLPAAVWGALGPAFRVYRSEDNLTWTEVPVAGAVTFAPFNNRFEIPIAATQARYLKAVVTPLPAAITTDGTYRNIVVTELQTYRVVTAAEARGKTRNLRGDVNTGVRVRLLEAVPLAYAFSGLLTHDDARDRLRYSVGNSLSLSTPVAEALVLDVRAERTDSELGNGREDQTRGSASLAYQPLPTLGANLGWSGQIQHLPTGSERSQTLTLFLRGDPYRGVSLSASGSLGLVGYGDGADGRQATAGANLSLAPSRWLTLTGGWGMSWSDVSGGTRMASKDRQSRVEGGVTVNPVPAIFLSASLAHLEVNGQGSNLVNVAGNLAPFPGGDLFVGFSYNESLDTRSDLRVRNWGPALRWKIRRGTFLDAGYAVLDSTSPAQIVHTRGVNARLSLALP